jgi:hypothetical protein
MSTLVRVRRMNVWPAVRLNVVVDFAIASPQ